MEVSSRIDQFMKTNKSTKTVIKLGGHPISVYAGRSVAKAFEVVSKDLTLYSGIRLTQFLEALYEQGRKDGARSVFE